MTVEQVIARRISRRSYLPTPLTEEQKTILCARIVQFSRAGGVRIELVENGARAFIRFGRSYGLFSGVQSFFAMIGREDDPHAGEKLGYFGELLVLEACGLGLGTCWVGGTFDPDGCPCVLAPGEKLFCVIPVGSVPERRGVKESLIYSLAHRDTKDLEEMYESDVPAPAWFMEGIQAVRRAPSARNRQPVRLRYAPGEVSASVPDMNRLYDIDLGIAKAHFALPAGGRWQWGSGGLFEKQGRGHYGMEISVAIDALLGVQRKTGQPV
ncbi:MAG: nitroreductase family protein [Intestinibacillus sp.]